MNHAVRPGQRPALRWILSLLVIAGVLTMHVLGGHDGGRSPVMAMAPLGIAATSGTGTDMSQMALSGKALSGNAASAQAPSSIVPAGDGMSDMSCCVLFLVTSVALALLALLATARRAESRSGVGGSPDRTVSWERGPPRSAPPQYSLCVLRV